MLQPIQVPVRSLDVRCPFGQDLHYGRDLTPAKRLIHDFLHSHDLFEGLVHSVPTIVASPGTRTGASGGDQRGAMEARSGRPGISVVRLGWPQPAGRVGVRDPPGCPRLAGGLARNENARRNLASVASNANASTSVVAFGLVAPSGKTYITARPSRCLGVYPRVSNLGVRFHERCPQGSHAPSHLMPRCTRVTPLGATPWRRRGSGSRARRRRGLSHHRAPRAPARRSRRGSSRRIRRPTSRRPRSRTDRP